MNVLYLNTAFKTAQIGLRKGEEFDVVNLSASAKTSENVMARVAQMLEEHDLAVASLDVICVVVGPGSFTGLRVGVALVKGLCAAHRHIKVCAVGSLDALAWASGLLQVGEEFAVVLNALGGRFFVKTFKNGKATGEAYLTRELPQMHLVGLYEEALSEVNQHIDMGNGFVAEANRLIEAEGFVSAGELAPVYLRLSQAEENWAG